MNRKNGKTENNHNIIISVSFIAHNDIPTPDLGFYK